MFGTLRVHRVAGHIGGEVFDFRLDTSLAEDMFTSLYATLLEYKVLFFHDQQYLDDDQHQTFGRRFSRIVAHPTMSTSTGMQLFEPDTSRSSGHIGLWRTDVTFPDAFPRVSILRVVAIPAYDDDTVWTNTACTREQLPDMFKQLTE